MNLSITKNSIALKNIEERWRNTHSVVKLLLYSLFIALFISTINNYVLIGICLIILAGLFLFCRKELLPGAVIISYLSLTGPSILYIRDYLAFVTLILLIFFFIYKHGLNIKKYPALPRNFIYFITFLIFTICLSAYESGLNDLSIYAIMRTTYLLIICYLFYALIDGKKGIYIYLISILISSFIVCISVYVEIAQSGFVIYSATGYLKRYAGIYSHSNESGILIMVSTIIAAGLFLLHKHNKKYKCLLILFLINNAFIFFILDSRGALGGTIAGLLILLYNYKKIIIAKLAGIMAIVVMCFLLVPPLQNLFEIYMRMETLGDRNELWEIGISMFKDHPVFGVGPELYANHFFTYIASYNFLAVENANLGGQPHPHNFLLWFTAENGILGFITVILLFSLFIYIGYKVIKRSKLISLEQYILSLIFLCAGISLILRSSLEVSGIFGYGYLSRDLPFWLLFLMQLFLYKHNSKISPITIVQKAG